MLSYRHSFHAGNFADIIKHVVLTETLQHFTKKDGGFEYIDTHSGAGLFNLNSADAQKLQEHNDGISKLKSVDFPELSDYFDAIRAYNPSGQLQNYPGSPGIAKHFLRRQDRAWLFELHPKDHKTLQANMRDNRKIRVEQKDGLAGMAGLLPPTSRRGMVLIDPSYELKQEYDQVVEAMIQGHKKFSSGSYAIWYPVVDRGRINTMERKLKNSGIKNIQRFELGLSADSQEHGMTASGMFVVNPPWTLFEKMSALLPKLLANLSQDPDGFFKCDVISAE